MLNRKNKVYTSPLDAVAVSHYFLKSILKEGDTVVDATAGNGFDTVFLAEAVGEEGQVWGFDLQDEALHKAEANLVIEGLSGRVHLIKSDHIRFADQIPAEHKGSVGAFLFNLGYLPGGDKEVTTSEPSTLAAFSQALDWIRPGGAVVMVLYPGHAEGLEERNSLLKKASSLPVKNWQCLHASSPLAHRKNPPEVLALRRRK